MAKAFCNNKLQTRSSSCMQTTKYHFYRKIAIVCCYEAVMIDASFGYHKSLAQAFTIKAACYTVI